MQEKLKCSDPFSGPWSFFRRARCLVGGAIVDDIDYYNRVHEMLHILTSKANRDNDSIEGFGARWDDDEHYKTKWTADYGARVEPSSARAVSFKPLFGLLNQSKYIPLMWSPLMFEFEILNGATDAILGHSAPFTISNSNIRGDHIRGIDLDWLRRPNRGLKDTALADGGSTLAP